LIFVTSSGNIGESYCFIVKKYFHLFKNRMQVNLEYRFDLAGYFFLELITVASFFVLWIAVYKDQDSVAGFDLGAIMAYYFLAPLIGALVTVELSNSLGVRIKDGFLSSLLIMPIKIWLLFIVNDLGRKFYPALVTIFFYALAGIGLYFLTDIEFDLNFQGIIFAFLFVVCGLFLGYALDLSLGFTAFWIDDIWGFKHLKYLAYSLLGGLSFPFEFLPENMQTVFNLLPFKYMYYLPLSYLLGNRTAESALSDLLGFVFWMIFAAILAAFLWKKGIKKYGAFGN